MKNGNENISQTNAQENNATISDNKNKNHTKSIKSSKKRKLENTPIVELNEKEIDTVSKRGRKRKKVDYQSLANPDNTLTHEDSTESVKESKYKPLNQNKNTIKSEETSPGSTNGTVKTPVGHTTQMLSTLFIQINQNTPKINDTTSETKNDSVVQIRKKGRRKKTAQPPETTMIKIEGESVQCAVCNIEMKKAVWTHHKQRFHNNLAWRIGDPPLDLNDQSLVLYTLNALYKKKKPLYCGKCGESKKSVVGFLSHQSVCNKSETEVEELKITCDLCGRKMMPVSLSMHMKLVHTDKPNVEEIKMKSEENVEGKREAAKKALKIIDENRVSMNHLIPLKNFDYENSKDLLETQLKEDTLIECKFVGCEFKSDNVDEFLDHIKTCSFKITEGFVCKFCLITFKQLKPIMKHLKSVHGIVMDEQDKDFDEGSDSTDDEEVNDVLPISSGSKVLPRFLQSCIKSTKSLLFPRAFKWTMKFVETNYSICLFTKLICKKNHLKILPYNLVEHYLPLLSESCHFAQTFVTDSKNPLEIDHKLNRLELFDSELNENGNSTIFCGGPITSMAWLPTPSDHLNENQMLAVSVLNDPNKKYRFTENYKMPGIIQFWNLGVLDNKNKNEFKPELSFGFAHEHGPVRDMQWCPSGCFHPAQYQNDPEERCGLLAATGSDGVVYIYAVPFSNGIFYKPIPVMKLFLQKSKELLGGTKYYPTKLSWSKCPGHAFLAVGYTNGIVALFNLNSSIYDSDENGTIYLEPMDSFQPHSHSITELSFMNGGNRWLLTGSLDRNVSFWDLKNLNYPITTVKRYMITDAVWLTHWMCALISCNELSAQTPTTIKQPRDYLSETLSMFSSDSTVTALSGSDWLNGVLQANIVGEISGTFREQLFYLGNQKRFRKGKRMILGYTCLIEKNKSVEERLANDKIRYECMKDNNVNDNKHKLEDIGTYVNESIDYLDAEEKYGLLFCDYDMNNLSNFPTNVMNTSKYFHTSAHLTKYHLYPLQMINKIAFNPNRQASTYYVTAYEVGLLRLAWLKFLRNDPEVK